jgi:hypothetical protein
MSTILKTGVFDRLDKPGYYAELSHSRMGWNANVELSESLMSELLARDLARPSQDSVSMPLHPTVRQTILVLLAQLARGAGSRRGLNLHPFTDQPEAIDGLVQVLGLQPLPSAGSVVALDLEQVTLNLETVPLEDVLVFRAEYASEHRAYVRNLRKFLRELSSIADPRERLRAIADRREELSEAAHDLKQSAQRRLRRPLAGFALGIAGAGWAGIGDPIGAALTAAGLIVSGLPGGSEPTAYSYLFRAERSLSRS